MRSKKIAQADLAEVDWNDGYFKHCDFESLLIEGGVIDSDFVSCSFKNAEWYWTLFTQSNFIQCRFEECVFRGATFAQVLFVECSFTNCRFLKDNLDSPCEFDRTVAYGSSIENGEGFRAEARG